jgi:hypothetical protein
MSDEETRPAWFPESGEDASLLAWWRGHPRRGWLWLEVEIGRAGPGQWPNRRSHRRIDAVHVPGHPRREIADWVDDPASLEQAVDGAEIEIVEAKRELDVCVIGQCVAGVDMFSRAYPRHGLVRMVAVVRGALDPALSWVCGRRGIEVVTLDEGSVQALRLPPPPIQTAFELGWEGGSTVVEWRSSRGRGERFRTAVDAGTALELIDESAEKRVSSWMRWGELLERLDAHQWTELVPLQLHPELEPRVLAALADRGASEEVAHAWRVVGERRRGLASRGSE